MQHWGPDELCQGMLSIEQLLGPKWIARKLQQEGAAQQEDRDRIEDRKNQYLFRKTPHPLILWWVLAQEWLASNVAKDSAVPESAYRIAVLASAIASAKNAAGFEKIIPRLKREEEFHSAAFEAVVAAAYVDRGYQVEFITESSHAKTPDLKVVRPGGGVFWVECKCRDEVIERDKAIRSFWKELQSALMRALGPAKINAMVAIKCLGEPARQELELLKEFVLRRLREVPPVNMFREPIRAVPVMDPSGKYQVVAQVIAPPDEEWTVDQFGFTSTEKFEYFSTGAEIMPLESGRATIKNPSHYAFKTDSPSNGIPGVINAFKSAVSQLPASGPGVVWLKIPDGAWADDFDGFLSRVVEALRNELSGEHNRRVNAAIVHARGFDREPLDGGSPIYRSVQLTVEHLNPRTPVV